MKEIRAVLEAYARERAAGHPAALATVVKVSGSSYRRPGARMLISHTGETTGGVSGGCLETDVVERALRVLQEGRPDLVTYDTTDDDDILTGVGLGCRGVVHILIEPLAATAVPFQMEILSGLQRGRRSGVLATVLHADGNPSVTPGMRLLLQEDGSVHSDITAPALTAQIQRFAEGTLESGRSRTAALDLPPGHAEVFFEFLPTPISLLLCGAGQDAVPLVRIATELGWQVTVADHRAAFADSSRFPQADAVLLTTPDALRDHVTLTDRTAVVIMTHNYLRDQALLETLLPSPAFYLGILGPRHRTERLLGDLHADGHSFPDAALARLHSPAGLDIGADTPEQIALSIVSEIQAVALRRPGSPLRDRPGSIYATEGSRPEHHTHGARPSCPLSAC